MTAIARTDLGPSVRPDARGRLRSSGPGAVIVEFRTDPTTPQDRMLHRGARRASTLLRLYASGSISRPQLAAAHRLVDDLAVAHGVSHRELYAPRGPSGAATGREPLPRQLDALARVRGATDALAAFRGIVWGVVVEDRSLDSIRGLRRADAPERLRLGLDLLGRHYGVIAS